jgi:AcrR family transcriptional regulator
VAEPADEQLAEPIPLRAADGRVPGRRGLATRQKLLACTEELLRSSSFRELTVTDIAKEAGTSPATFYQYFPDVEAAIAVLAEDLSTEGSELLPDVVRSGSWRGKAGYETALRLVDGFLDLWERHRSVLRVIDLATDEGDRRFHNIRTHLLNQVTVALADVIRRERDAGRHPADLDPMASAGVLTAMLAHVAAHRYGFEFWGIATDDVRTSLGRIVFTTVTGQKPPSSTA